MPPKCKETKLPCGSGKELKVSTTSQKKWSEDVESLVTNLAKAKWRTYNSRPRGDDSGYFVVLHWYHAQQMWVPIYLQHSDCVSSQLTKIFQYKEATPIAKYLSSFPRMQRKRVWLKWVLDLRKNGQPRVEFKDVLQAFSDKYNLGETLPFNSDDDELTVPENYSILG